MGGKEDIKSWYDEVWHREGKWWLCGILMCCWAVAAIGCGRDTITWVNVVATLFFRVEPS